jgi:hypothetical protein
MEATGMDSALDAEFDTAVTEFRSVLQAASRRPEGFWSTQRDSVMSKLAGRQTRPAWRVALVWTATAVFVVAGIGILLDRPQAAPPPDLAAGYDQELLIDVERSLAQEVPEPLDAAFLLTAEMERGSPTQSAR